MQPLAMLDPLLGPLYQTVDDWAAWTPFLSSLCAVTRTDNAALLVHDLRTAESTIAFCHVEVEQVRRYRQEFAALSPYMPSPDDTTPVGVVLRTEQVISVEDLRKTKYYREWAQQNNVVYGIALNLGIEEGRFTFLSLNNGEASGPIPDWVVWLVEALGPHVARAVRLQAGRLRLETWKQSLERTAGAVFFVSQSGKLVDTTPSADLLMQQGKVIWADAEGNLRLASRTEQDALLKAIRRADLHPYQVVRVRGDDLAIVTALPHAKSESGLPGLRMITLLHPAASSHSVDIFGPLLHLTSAETRLVRALLHGGTLSAAARLLQISRETAKTQLAGVFAKTRTKRQND